MVQTCFLWSPTPLLRSWKRAFAKSSAEGLLLLASHELAQELPAALVFWRGLARQFFQAVCQLGEGGPEVEIRLPRLRRTTCAAGRRSPADARLGVSKPALLQSLWNELRELAAARAAEFPRRGRRPGSASVNPLWHLLGRVTFHLAENKRDPQRPFAFLATYTHQLSGQARLQHLPLAEALKTYAGAKDRHKLESLLEPVRRAAEQSALVRELLDSKALFAPQAWTHPAGVSLSHRVAADRGRRASWCACPIGGRPAGRRGRRCRCGSARGRRAQLGLDELLDFEVGLALDGEPLTEDERRQLLAGTEGLVLLRGKWVEVDREQLQAGPRPLEAGCASSIPTASTSSRACGCWPAPQLERRGRSRRGGGVDWSRITAGDWLRETLERIAPARAASTPASRAATCNATLRPYQADGVRWLWFMTELGLGACLADDMGLGKTIQVIDLLLQREARRRRQRTARPSLLVVPASLIGNWRQELARFAPSLRVFFAHRSECDADDAGPSGRRSRAASWPDSIWSSPPTAWCGGRSGWRR